ncbi:HTH domain-containing protein, partial [Clostridioides difficile]|uniref:HTH domain-containing protein n=1 Tax=Clostridioides difficile TaxID=1496 RepID=UPI00115CFBD0
MDFVVFGSNAEVASSQRSFTAGELAEEFSVSKRTILRDLQVLESIGFPLYSKVGAAGG